ncbi:uncharacterized protein LOC131151806 isoform X1 [Malania oleifera]|uniref:uncharacterized protein LOC131151806 isoform X1 n=1 Tax=Malania oleifera TaxID=397392 RepID=UPI0025ADE108|nr:uncharacterized protein LOC131151806 isoform X1 [Malania oleifera]
MDVTSAQSTHSPNPRRQHELMLQESIDHFLSEFYKFQPDFSGLSSVFARLVQTMHDPPLEIIWFYSALTFRSNSAADDPLARVSVVKDLFQLLVSCSASCNGVKRVALLAPVIFKLCELVTSENIFWLRREIDCFVEGIVSYITMCCCQDSENDDGSVHLTGCFVDLLRVWTVDQGEENRNFEEALRLFFPLVSEGVRQGVGVGCGAGYLAGVVTSEAFLLLFCFKFGSGGPKAELQKNLLSWASDSIIGFKNWYFFDIILRTLLDPILPVTSLLVSMLLFDCPMLIVIELPQFRGFIGSWKPSEFIRRLWIYLHSSSPEDEVLMRRVLYDTMVMIEHPFLDSDSVLLPANCLKNLAITWLLVADDAVQFIRKHGDQTKAISYIDAFTESRLISQLIEWISNHAGMKQKLGRPNVSTPADLIRWLLILEDQGVRLFDHIFKFHDKAIVYKSRADQEFSVFEPDIRSLDNVFLPNDSKGEEKVEVVVDQATVGSVDAVFLAATCTSKLTGADRRRKRKEGDRVEGKTQAKFVKYHLDEMSIGQKFLSSGDEDGLSSGNEVENLVSDEDMEDMEH